jgi:hypothetical protein
MNLAEQIEQLVGRGFSEERAETIVLMREAVIIIFDAFPETLVLVGGANLVLFQESVRFNNLPSGVRPSNKLSLNFATFGISPESGKKSKSAECLYVLIATREILLLQHPAVAESRVPQGSDRLHQLTCLLARATPLCVYLLNSLLNAVSVELAGQHVL